MDGNEKDLSISRQCGSLQLPRPSYHRPKASYFESAENVEFMKIIDEEFPKYPFYGSRKMRDYLNQNSLFFTLVNKLVAQHVTNTTIGCPFF